MNNADLEKNIELCASKGTSETNSTQNLLILQINLLNDILEEIKKR